MTSDRSHDREGVVFRKLWMRQIGGVLRLELKKTFLSRRGWWVYLLALGPVALTMLHWLIETGRHSNRHSIGEDSLVFAGLFHFYFLRLGIFFGCVGIFSNLFRGEMLEKTLHYYYLTPMRREFLVIMITATGEEQALKRGSGARGEAPGQPANFDVTQRAGGLPRRQSERA